MRSLPLRRGVRLMLAIAVLIPFLLPGPAAAHAALIASDPEDGARLSAPPASVEATYDEPLDRQRSTITLRDDTGATIAAGGVDPDDPDAMRMRVDDLPQLSPGRYEVRWTAVTPDDDGVERGNFAFEVAAAAPTQVATPSPSAGPTPPGGTGGGDVLVPLVALAALVAAGAALLLRRPRRDPPSPP